MIERPASPEIRRDRRFLLHFTVCGLTTMAVVCAGCFIVALELVPDELEMPVFFGSISLGLVLAALTFVPVFFGIGCLGCGRRIFQAPARDHPPGRTPIRFHCPTCDVEWDTGVWWGGD